MTENELTPYFVCPHCQSGFAEKPGGGHCPACHAPFEEPSSPPVDDEHGEGDEDRPRSHRRSRR